MLLSSLLLDPAATSAVPTTLVVASAVVVAGAAYSFSSFHVSRSAREPLAARHKHSHPHYLQWVPLCISKSWVCSKRVGLQAFCLGSMVVRLTQSTKDALTQIHMEVERAPLYDCSCLHEKSTDMRSALRH